ncbi:MAG: glycoside hydrolase family protein [Terriglobales bacterium]
MIANLTDQLIRDEGLRLEPYTDTVGKITIGVGRNLSDVGISVVEAQQLLVNDIANATARLEETFPWTAGLDEVRRAALLNMAFNMGIRGLSQFQNFLAAMRTGDWESARNEMLNSRWAQQVGARAQRLAIQIETGVWQ